MVRWGCSHKAGEWLRQEQPNLAPSLNTAEGELVRKAKGQWRLDLPEVLDYRTVCPGARDTASLSCHFLLCKESSSKRQDC